MHDRAELVAAPLHHARCYVAALREASSRQGQGYGKLILALALEECRRLGLARVLATCLRQLLGRIIEANGGALENVIEDPAGQGPLRRFWIAL